MLYDCFTFYNELELLEVRLNTLNDIVDKFVLIESTVTYTNVKKKLYYNENKKKFNKFHDKIINVIVRDSPAVSHTWIIEHYLMAATVRGLTDAKPHDTILISNLDEIPRPEKVKQWMKKKGKLKGFEQQFFYYYLNFASKNSKWVGTKMLQYKDFLTYQDAYIIRHSPIDIKIPDGGWHFSYMGGLERIQDKLRTGSHTEFNNAKYTTKEKIIQAIKDKKDLFDHGDKFDLVTLDLLPEYIRDHKEKYAAMLLNPNNTFT